MQKQHFLLWNKANIKYSYKSQLANLLIANWLDLEITNASDNLRYKK